MPEREEAKKGTLSLDTTSILLKKHSAKQQKQTNKNNLRNGKKFIMIPTSILIYIYIYIYIHSYLYI